jgi:hypothetical protein
MAKWIEFIERPNPNRKTRMFFVRNKEHLVNIGEIKWHGGFRKYSFFPYISTVWESTCLADVVDFLNQLTEQRNANRLQKAVSKV